MKLQLNTQETLNLFTRYGAGFVEVNKTPYTHPLLMMGEQLTPWAVAGFDALTPEDFAALLAHAPELVLFGSGDRLRFPHPRLLAALTNQGIGVEVMDTPAACRTYNFLMAEGRRVLAVLLV